MSLALDFRSHKWVLGCPRMYIMKRFQDATLLLLHHLMSKPPPQKISPLGLQELV